MVSFKDILPIGLLIGVVAALTIFRREVASGATTVGEAAFTISRAAGGAFGTVVGAPISFLGAGAETFSQVASTALAGIGRSIQALLEAGANVQRGIGILPPKDQDRAGARPSPELPPPYRPPFKTSGFGILEEGDIAEIIEGLESGIRGVISATGVSERPWRVAGVRNVYQSSELREIEDRLGARAR